MKIIDVTNGDFLLLKDVVINQATTYTQLREQFPDNKYWEVGTGYFWIYFYDIIVEQQQFYVDICFKGEELNRIIFEFKGIYEKDSSWEDFDEEKELKKKKSYEKWIAKTLGNTEFPWGKVNAFYDPKSCSAGIVLNYTKQK